MTKYNKYKKAEMNRHKSIGVSNSRSGNRSRGNANNPRTDVMRMSDFDDFDRMFEDFGMRGIGGGLSGLDRFFGGFSSISRRFEDMERNLFSNFESVGNSNSNMPGTFISKSYVSKVKYNQNGEPERESYQTQSIRQVDREGKKIQEKQQAYQNSRTGVQKAAHERLLDEKGHKIVKARNRNTGEEYEHNLYKGINEEELDTFNNEYSGYRKKVNFENNYKMINEFGNRRSLPQANNQRTNNVRNSNYANPYSPKALPSQK